VALRGLSARFIGNTPDQLWAAFPATLVSALSVFLAVGLYFWYLYRPARMLARALRKSGYEPVLTSSSPELVTAVESLKGIRLASRWSRSGGFLVFVDIGPKFELWRWRHGRVECVVRIPWSCATSWEFGSVTFAYRSDRAILLWLRVNGRDFALPICPQTSGLIATGAARDAQFAAALNVIESRVLPSGSVVEEFAD